MNNALARELKALRERMGLTQEEAARRVGYGKSSYCNWEKGVSTPSLETLIALSRLYGVSLDTLCGVAPQDGPCGELPLALLPNMLIALVRGGVALEFGKDRVDGLTGQRYGSLDFAYSEKELPWLRELVRGTLHLYTLYERQEVSAETLRLFMEGIRRQMREGE